MSADTCRQDRSLQAFAAFVQRPTYVSQNVRNPRHATRGAALPQGGGEEEGGWGKLRVARTTSRQQPQRPPHIPLPAHISARLALASWSCYRCLPNKRLSDEAPLSPETSHPPLKFNVQTSPLDVQGHCGKQTTLKRARLSVSCAFLFQVLT